MSRRHPDRFKIPHNRDLTHPHSSDEEITFIDYDKRYRQEVLEAGYFLNGQGDPVRAGELPVATIDIATHLGSSRVGCGTVLRSDSINDHGTGSSPLVERNRIVLRAFVKMLGLLKTPHTVTVTTVSDYLVDNMMEGRAHRWRREGWRKANGEPIKSPELWQHILALGAAHRLRFQYPTGTRSQSMAQAEQLALHHSTNPGASKSRVPQPEGAM